MTDLAAALAEAIQYDWRAIARPEQLVPAGDWSTWLILAGRGFGKTRTGAEWVWESICALMAHKPAGNLSDELA